MSTPIKFGTDGWRAIIAQEYTVENVARVAEATVNWIKEQNDSDNSIVIGHDCRFGGQLFAETTAKVALHHGLKVYMSKGFVSTPMVSLAARKYQCPIGVVITASHNPPSYNGFKLKSIHGGPLIPSKISEVEDLIKDTCSVSLDSVDLVSAETEGQLVYVDLETEYVEKAEENFDMEVIRTSGIKFGYDAMYGAGQNAVRRLLPEAFFMHCDYNPSFMGQAPEPIEKNLQEFKQFIEESGEIDCGLANDGDADRIGLFDNKGNFVDSHHIILLLIHYLVKYKELKGKVVTAFSCTPKIKKLCDHYGLEHQTVKIGFKHIAGIMIDEDVLLGGEESGGIATKDHIPERDGIWMGLILFEFMAKSGKSLNDLINEVYEIVGEFKFERNDLHIDETLKQNIIKQCEAGEFVSFGKYNVEKVETIDGWKYFFDDSRWLMIRPSGTEPVLRTYAEAPTLEEVRQILKACEETIVN